MLQSYSEIYGLLIQNLYKVSIMYFPSSLFKTHDESYAESSYKEITDQVYFFKENGDMVLVTNEFNSLEFLKKPLFLDENVMILYGLKQKYSREEYKFMVTKYYQQVVFYCWLNEWLINHLAETKIGLNKAIRDKFQSQKVFINQHRDTLVTMCNEIGIDTMVLHKEESIKVFKTTFNTLKDFRDPLKTSVLTSTDKRKLKRQEIRQFTEAYADALILQKVFNVPS